jgi:hypothetical protein
MDVKPRREGLDSVWCGSRVARSGDGAAVDELAYLFVWSKWGVSAVRTSDARGSSLPAGTRSG